MHLKQLHQGHLWVNELGVDQNQGVLVLVSHPRVLEKLRQR